MGISEENLNYIIDQLRRIDKFNIRIMNANIKKIKCVNSAELQSITELLKKERSKADEREDKIERQHKKIKELRKQIRGYDRRD